VFVIAASTPLLPALLRNFVSFMSSFKSSSHYPERERGVGER